MTSTRSSSSCSWNVLRASVSTSCDVLTLPPGSLARHHCRALPDASRLFVRATCTSPVVHQLVTPWQTARQVGSLGLRRDDSPTRRRYPHEFPFASVALGFRPCAG